MESPAVQELRGQQQFQANTVYRPEPSSGFSRLERNRERQHQLVRQTDVPKPRQHMPQQGNNRGNPEQQKPQASNVSSYYSKQSSDPSRIQYQIPRQQRQLPRRTDNIGPQQRQQEVNDCCYVEQATEGTWLERHGITATYEPKPKKRPNILRRLFKKINMWIISNNSGGYRSRRLGRE
ncbi:hypothetical protein PG988_005244 [Apiospora saccharicola]